MGVIMLGLWTACDNKTKSSDKHSETYIRQRVDTIYSTHFSSRLCS